MSFTSSNRAYTNRALKHFIQFIQDHQLIDKHDDMLVAVSGGLDSMVLGYLLFSLKRYGYSGKLRFIYVNHNTRKNQIKERDLVEAYAKHLGVQFVSKTLHDLNPNRNFEHNARMKRYQVMKGELGINEVLVFAHHINDSYEWSILQGLRSSNLDSIIGIPAKNERVRRPFMCFTKNQIYKIGKYFDIPYIQDPTNELVKYERNFLRHKIIKSLAIRHPQYLRHYVNRHNELARRLGVHLIYKQQVKFQVKKGENYVELVNISPVEDLSGLDSLILKSVKQINPGVRGNLHGQIQKIKQALKNHKYGPLKLSGGTSVYMDFNYLFICNDTYKLSSKFQIQEVTLSYGEYKNFLKQNSLPMVVVINQNIKGFVFSKRKHPLLNALPESIGLEKLRYVSATNLLRQWAKTKNISKTLKLRLFLPS